MTKRQAHVQALRTAYAAVEKACGVGGVEAGGDVEHEVDQRKVNNALDAIAQGLYERWKRAEDRLNGIR